ncbi:MAG: PorT family protein [Tannerella sp.]|jgi:long-subunit fatty acid transport protein|nr:PorT family protein [Tannerella sp.]
MKNVKFLLIVAAMFAVSAADARFRFGVKGGLNVAGAKFEKKYFKSDNITGFHVGPALEGMIGQGGIGIETAVLYSQKGFDSDNETVRNAFLEIPLNLKFKFGLPLVNPYVAAGPYIDVRVAGDNKWDVSKTAEGVIHQIKTKSFGAGLNFSAGAELFKNLQLGLTCSLGLTDNYETFDAKDIENYKGKAHTWSVTAAVFF